MILANLFLGVAIAALMVYGTPALIQSAMGSAWTEGQIALGQLRRQLRLHQGRVLVRGLTWVAAILTLVEVLAVVYWSLFTKEAMTLALVAGAGWLVSIMGIVILIWLQWHSFARYQRDENGAIKNYPEWEKNEHNEVLNANGTVATINGHVVMMNDAGEPRVNGTTVTEENALAQFRKHPHAGEPEVVVAGFRPETARPGWSIGIAIVAAVLNGILLLHLGAAAHVRQVIALGLTDIVLALGPIILAGKLLEGALPQDGRLQRLVQAINHAPKTVLATVFTTCAWVVVFPYTGILNIVAGVLFVAALLYAVASYRGEEYRVKTWLRNAAVAQAIVLVPVSVFVLSMEELPKDGDGKLIRGTTSGWYSSILDIITGQIGAKTPDDVWFIAIPMALAALFGMGILMASARAPIGGWIRKILPWASVPFFIIATFNALLLLAVAMGMDEIKLPQYTTRIEEPEEPAPAPLVTIVAVEPPAPVDLGSINDLEKPTPVAEPPKPATKVVSAPTETTTPKTKKRAQRKNDPGKKAKDDLRAMAAAFE